MTRTLRAGLIGAGLSRSRFADALALMCGEAGIGFTFEPIDTAGRPDFDFAACVRQLADRGWTGVSVTHPWKLRAAELAGPGMAPEVARLGAANLLRFGPTLTGFNTDYTGFLGAWAAETGGAAPGRVAMAGAGGVAAAVGPALARLGAARIDIWDLDPARAAALAARIGPVAHVADDPAEAVAVADGLVNATALGMGEDRRTAFPDIPRGARWAFDAVYTPVGTPFLRAAAAAGLSAITGFDLFRHMALDAFAAYTGEAPDRAALLPKLAALRPEA